jgi:hypothetical protein
VYWPDFIQGLSRCTGQMLIEVKGSHIRDRALHKVKAAIRPARALGFVGIWLAVWRDGKWDVSELIEG